MKSYWLDTDQVFLNDTNTFYLLRPIELEEIAEIVADFQKIQYSWAVDVLCSKSRNVGALGQPMLRGLVGLVPKDQPNTWYCTRMRANALPPEAWDIAEKPCSTPAERAVNVPRLSVENQEAIIRRAAGGDIQQLDKLIPGSQQFEITGLYIEQDLAASASPKDFIECILNRCIDERVRQRPVRYKDGEGFAKKNRSPIAECLLLYLVERGVAIFPYDPHPFMAKTRGLELLVLSRDSEELWDHYVTTYQIVYGEIEHRGSHKSIEKRAMLRRTFYSFLLCSNMRSNVVEQLFDDFIVVAGSAGRVEARERALRFMKRALASKSSGRLPVRTNQKRRKTTLSSRFDWVCLRRDETNDIKFPEFVPLDYIPLANIQIWRDRFVADIPKLMVKAPNNVVNAYNLFLIWLAWSGNPASDIGDLSREDMHDTLPNEQSVSFRAFLIRRDTSPMYTTNNISRMSDFFERQILERRLDYQNPIIMRLDVVPSVIKRGKTPRMPLGPEMLVYTREFNSRDDFAFSKSKDYHYRILKGEKVWFPAIAIILDFLLRLPVRSHQARFLDSGEGDELIPSFDAGLEYVRNESKLATKGRKQFALTVVQGIDGQNILGIYFNTNKTMIGDEEGYEVPWCDEAIRSNIMRMREWQSDHNPIEKPIICLERVYRSENPDVLSLVSRVYPLFRDPDENGDDPPSRAVIRRYWDDLCSAVEDEISESEQVRKIKLTEFKEVAGRRQGTYYNRRTAIYDIHTLRVSGITALIEAGLPPDVLMIVAGHHTVAMTLYYNKVSASRVNEALAKAIRLTAETLSNLDQDEYFDALNEHLINTRDEADRAGWTLLRRSYGKGEAGIEFLSHGICPGGECETGGEWIGAGNHMAVPRPRACSLCRYRLTGPMFLPGLVLNVNRLMHELRGKGIQVGELYERIRAEDNAKRSTNILRAQVASLDKEIAIIAREWAAEVSYVKEAEGLLAKYLASHDVSSGSAYSQLPVLANISKAELTTRLERKSEFVLLQSLLEGSQDWIGFEPVEAKIDHREFLNEVCNANDMRAVLLSMSGKDRDIAAIMLGRALIQGVPDDEISALRSARGRLSDFPSVMEAFATIEESLRLRDAGVSHERVAAP